MPKKLSEHPEYVESLREYLKSKRDEVGGTKALHVLLYGVEPEKKDEQRLINLLNRGALSGEFIGLCADKLELGEVTLNELYKLNQS